MITMPKPPCRNSVWFGFGDCLKSAIFACRISSCSCCCCSPDASVPPIFDQLPIVGGSPNLACMFSTSIPRGGFLGFSNFQIFFEKLDFFEICLDLGNFSAHNCTRAPTSHHPIAMKLDMHVLHINSLGGFLGFSNFLNIFRKLALSEIRLDLKHFQLTHHACNWTRATTCHHPIAMKLGMPVLHINTQRGISRIFEFRNIFRKTLFFRNLFGLGEIFQLTYPANMQTLILYIGICHPYSIHWCLNIDTYIDWHPYS